MKLSIFHFWGPELPKQNNQVGIMDKTHGHQVEAYRLLLPLFKSIFGSRRAGKFFPAQEYCCFRNSSWL